jgi:hypothetical protein
MSCIGEHTRRSASIGVISDSSGSGLSCSVTTFATADNELGTVHSAAHRSVRNPVTLLHDRLMETVRVDTNTILAPALSEARLLRALLEELRPASESAAHRCAGRYAHDRGACAL